MPDQDAATMNNRLLYSQLSNKEALIQWCKIRIILQYDIEHEWEKNLLEIHVQDLNHEDICRCFLPDRIWHKVFFYVEGFRGEEKSAGLC